MVPLPSAVVFLLLFTGGLARDAVGQFLPFGRNKVNYMSFDWRVLKTDHFAIYFYPEMETLARRGAAIAEESFHELEQVLNFTITEPIPLIFYSSPIHFQQTNITPGFIPEGVGGLFEFIKGRVVIPYNGSMTEFRYVIRHELVHVFMHEKVESVLRRYNLQPERYPPLWFVEGIAEHFSTSWDSQAEMVLRDAVHSGYFVPLASISEIAGSFLMYKEGQSVIGYIEREFGSEAIVRILENLWKSPDFNEVIEWSLGIEAKELDRRWQSWLRKRIYPLVSDHEMPSAVGDIIIRGGMNAKPVFYRDGDSLFVLYMANVTGYAGIYSRPLSGGKARLLLEGEKSDEMEAFHLHRSGMSVNRQHLLAFVAQSGGKDVLHLFDLRRERIARTLSFPGLVVLNSPSWSPDGKKIVMSALAQSGQSDLFIVDLERDSIAQVTDDIYDDRDPAWSPDGKTIVFSSDRSHWGEDGRMNLFACDPSTGEIRSVIVENADCLSPSWSPDGSLLAFTCDRAGVHEIYVLRYARDGGAQRRIARVTNFLTSAFDPVWTEDGGLLCTAFERYGFPVLRLPTVSETLDSLETVSVAAYDDADCWSVSEWAGETAVQSLRYEKEYALDIAQSQISTDPVFGTIGGAVLSVSDLLGNDNYSFLVYNTAQSTNELLSSFSLAISHVQLGKRVPIAYGIFSFSGRRYDLLDPDEYFQERAYGGYFALSYPLSMFRRIEGSVSLTNSDKESLYELRQRKALLLTNTISYVHDNALFTITGPLDGSRFNLTLSFTTDIRYSNVNYFSVMADYRRYFRIASRSAVAARLEMLYNDGKEARRYFLGGSWDLRGWPRWSIRGTKRWLASAELRFPLLDRVGFAFPFGEMNLGILRGAVYFDAGNAWDVAYGTTLGSIGAGLRLGLFGVLVLRYDFGKRIENGFSMLQDGLFHQFFFGWDF
ncbi:MAG: BamA/TamA family outer membrane protein [Bacteroidota bacterium]|nr:BamA/TamA family outer membrane protein [Bacteroidota bacterium]